MNPLYNYFVNQGSAQNNIASQLKQLQNNPQSILDILYKCGKINQTQYSDLQPYKNDPKGILEYLINNGKAQEILQARKFAEANYGK